MDLHLYDTATGSVRPLEQRDPAEVSMYVCGPTVYDFPHIGHGRQALTYDILRRYIESRGVRVHHVSNITDIEDKIIARAKEQGVDPDEVTSRFEDEWWKAVDALGILRPTQDPHATAYVDQMVELIGELMERGHAYETSDSIYFASASTEGYGLLAQQSLDSLQAGARVEADAEKRSPVDFVLWKKIEPAPGEPTWPSPWGPGRPGWHTECVVMSLDLLGDGFDLHTGGQDLKFPHHENERAQAVAMGKAFARHWMHHGFVEVGGEKMSKSLGNFTTLTDMLERTDPRAYRLLVLRSHYRSPMEVTVESTQDAEAALARLDDFVRRFAELPDGPPDATAIDAFNRAMDDDLDTPKAMAELFGAVRGANADLDAGRTSQAEAKARAVLAMASAVGLALGQPEVEVDAMARELVEARDAARAAKDWAKADELRDRLQELGWTVEDTAEGTTVHR